jgi:protein gp37
MFGLPESAGMKWTMQMDTILNITRWLKLYAVRVTTEGSDNVQRTKIEWVINSDGSAGFTSNPIRGKCGHFGTPTCGSYCYAERIRQRFQQPEELSFHPEELRAIEDRKKPATIFMGSMYDIFGAWVPSVYILEILNTARKCPQHTFIFLTKNPARYGEFEFSPNCWIGYSDDGTKDERNWVHFKGRKNRFVSFEPLIGRLINVNMDLIDAVIIGAMTGPNSIRPDRDIIDGIISAAGSKPVFLKNNLLNMLTFLGKRQELAWTI